MSSLIEVDAAVCQASYGNHFIKSISVMDKSDSSIKVSTSYRTSNDPYTERQLGHYSSTLLLEMAKQILKAGVVLNYDTNHPDNRWIASEVRMTFNQYLVLDAAYELYIECESREMQFRKGKANTGKTTILFTQERESGEGVVVFVDWLCTTPAIETRMEQTVRDKISAKA